MKTYLCNSCGNHDSCVLSVENDKEILEICLDCRGLWMYRDLPVKKRTYFLDGKEYCHHYNNGNDVDQVPIENSSNCANYKKLTICKDCHREWNKPTLSQPNLCEDCEKAIENWLAFYDEIEVCETVDKEPITV